MSNPKHARLILIGTAVLIPVAAWASGSISYSYDAHGRLIQVDHDNGVNPNLLVNYSYDAADNRGNVVVTGSPN